jgi:hypothetical protein
MKATLSRWAGAAVAGLVLTFANAGGVDAQVPNISGTWIFTVVVEGGGGTPTVTIVQEGNALTGHYSSETLGEADFTGTVEGNTFTITFSADPGLGQQVPVTYAGEIESATSLKGTFDLGGLAGGTFTAAPKPDA